MGLIVIQATPAENVLTLCSKSVHSQVSATLFYVRTVTFVLPWICTDNTQASHQQAKCRQYYLSQNVSPAVAGSAGPALPPVLGFLTANYLALLITPLIYRPT